MYRRFVRISQWAHVHPPPRSPLYHTVLCCCLVAKLCPTLCDCMDCSPPGSSVHGILQARVLEWGAIAFSGGNNGFAHYKHICIYQNLTNECLRHALKTKFTSTNTKPNLNAGWSTDEQVYWCLQFTLKKKKWVNKRRDRQMDRSIIQFTNM